MGKVKRLGPRTRGQLVVVKFSVGCKCHNHNVFSARIVKIERVCWVGDFSYV